MSFKVIETQEELDAVIGERIERAKNSVRKEYDEKYSDYDSLKERAESFDTKTKEYEDKINTLNEKVSSFKELEKKNKQLETDSLKVKIALDNGIPYQMASRLKGDDEESILKDAKTMAQFMRHKKTPPLRDTEAKKGDESYRKLLKGLHINKGE